MKIKAYIIRIIYIALFCVIMWMADKAFYLRTPHGILQGKAFYKQPKNTIDVAMIGSSHVHCNINPAVLWRDYGIASYDMTAAEQPMWVSYYYIREFCKRQDPKVIVIDMFSPVVGGDSFNERWMPDDLYGIRFSLNKVKMMYNTCSAGQIDKYFPSFFGYHSRYDEMKLKLIPASIKNDIGSDFKGYTGYDGVYTENHLPASGITEKRDLQPKTRKYLEKIIDYTKKNDIELFLVVSPYPSKPEHEMVYNGLEDLAKEKGILFINSNHDFEEMGMDLMTDFSDTSHLNISGGTKFTDYLGKILDEKYDLPDRRGDERYTSWDENAKQQFK